MSFAKLSGTLEAVHNEIKDLRLHQYSGDKAGSLEGEVYYDPTLHVPKIALNGSHAALLAEPTAAPPTLVVGQAPVIGVSLKGMRADAKMGLPSVATGAADGFMPGADKAKLDAATATPTANALAKYDASMRLLAADATSGQQVVNFQTMQAQIALNQQGLAEKDPCRGLFTVLPANTYSSGTKRITGSANGALAATPDGVGSWQVNDRVFFTGTIGTGSAQAGPYRIAQVGSASLPFILERTADFGGPGAPAGQRLIGALIQVLEGSEHGDTFWVCTNDSITLDTTVLVFRKQTAADVDNSTIELDAAGNLRVKDGGITYAKMQNGGALSVPGRSANSAGVLADISATADGQVLRRSGTTLGFGTVANAGLANMAESTIKGRATGAGTGAPADLTAAQVRTLLNVADGANAYAHPNHSGDVVSASDGATTIQPGVVANAKLAPMATKTIKGRSSAASGDPEDLTPSLAREVLGIAGAERIDRPLKSSFGSGWVKFCTLKVTAQNYSCAAVVDVSSGGRNLANDNSVVRAYCRIRQTSAMSSGLDIKQVQYVQQGGGPASFTLGYTIDQDDASAKIVSVWVATGSSNDRIMFSVIGTWSDTPSSAPVFFENGTVEASAPAGFTAASLSDFNADDATFTTIKATGLAAATIRKAVIGTDGSIQAGDATTDTFIANIGDGATATIVVAHGLGTKDLVVTLVENATNERVGCKTVVDATNITFYFSSAPAIDAYRVIAKK